MRDDEGDGDSRAGGGNTPAASGAGGADYCVGGPAANRIRPSSNSRKGGALIQTLVTIRKKGFGGSGKRNKGKDHKNDVKCWNCGKTGHYARNCSERRCSRGEGKGRPETGTKGCEHADRWTWSDEHVDGLWKKTDWQSPGQWMPTMRLLECRRSNETSEINSMERCWNKNPRRGEKN